MNNQTPFLKFPFHVSKDITIESIDGYGTKSKFLAHNSQVDENNKEKDDDSDFFNPLVYCAVTMDEEPDDNYYFALKDKNISNILDKNKKKLKDNKNVNGNENSSLMCNNGDVKNKKSKMDNKNRKRLACHICQKTFGWTTDLKRHKLTHTGERPFKCTDCGATFTRNFLLKKHQSKLHDCKTSDEESLLNMKVANNLMEIHKIMKEQEMKKLEIGVHNVNNSNNNE